jgi:hypothetical protein
LGEKDISEKALEAYNDVFADIVNVLLFDGRRLVDEDALEDRESESSYKADESLHSQGRDVAKLWKNGIVRLACIGIENQTTINSQMALRVIGYDGAEYRVQYETEHSRSPVVTFILYFGTDVKWADEIHLKDYLDIPNELKDYVSDYTVKVFSIAYLPQETVDKFTSDFGVVAEYFVQKRTQPHYTPSPRKLKHVRETLELLRVMGGKHKFIETYNKFYKDSNVALGGGSYTMRDFIDTMLDEAESKGIAEGHAEGRAEGRAEGVDFGKLGATILYYRKGRITLEEAASDLGISTNEFIEKMNNFPGEAV